MKVLIGVILLIIGTQFFLPIQQIHTSTSSPSPYYYHITAVHADLSRDFASGSGIVVAIIDSGFDVQQINARNLFTNENEIPDNGIDDDANGYIDDYQGWDVRSNDNNVSDLYTSHGTEMATTLVQYAPNVTILPIKFLKASSSSTFTFGVSDTIETFPDAIDYAVSMGARVISLSIGIDAVLHTNSANAIDRAIQHNVTIVAASGNDDKDHLYYPAAYDNVISVGSIDEYLVRSIWENGYGSNYGSDLDVVAPGSAIYTTTQGGSLVIEDGTSFSTVAVAGLLAQMYELNPDLTPNQAKGILKNTAQDLGPLGFDTEYGNGLINYAKAVRYVYDKVPPSYISSNYSIITVSDYAGIFDLDIQVNDDSGISSCFIYYKNLVEDEYSRLNFCSSGPIYSNKSTIPLHTEFTIQSSMLSYYLVINDFVDHSLQFASKDDPIIIATGLTDQNTDTTTSTSITSTDSDYTSSVNYESSDSTSQTTSSGEWKTYPATKTTSLPLVSLLIPLVILYKKRGDTK